MWKVVRYIVRVPLALIHMTVVLLPLLLAILLVKKLRWWRFERALIIAWSRIALRIFGIRLAVEGEKPALTSLWVANHLSWLDIEVLHAVEAVAFISKAEVEKWPLIGTMAAAGGTLFHRRGSAQSLNRVANELTDVMRSGRPGAIFPEGKVGPGDQVLKFHARLFQTAIDADIPVQPVAIDYRLGADRHHQLPFQGDEQFVPNALRLLGLPSSHVVLTFGKPIAVAGHSRRALAQLAHDQVVSLWKVEQKESNTND
ncbi:MAG: 1-acyl-sn-glycerol-3-phosphate acyltransferase [Lysobacteraceae bacterium]|nr:MAG: 1-acyl-sn-glycerol-3-phosphate acyltransferase [Xanthomonadaceae bacterium]